MRRAKATHAPSSLRQSSLTWCGGVVCRYVKSNCSSPLVNRHFVFVKSLAAREPSSRSGNAVKSITHGATR